MLNLTRIKGVNIIQSISKLGILSSFLVFGYLICSTSCGGNSTDAAGSDAAQDTTATLSATTGTGGGPGDAKNFHTGRFKYEDENVFGDFVLIRSRDTQIDSGGLTKLSVKFDLKWENDTTYKLTYLETLSNGTNVQLPDMTGMHRNCRMTEIKEDSYIEISTSSLNKDTLRAKIFKLK